MGRGAWRATVHELDMTEQLSTHSLNTSNLGNSLVVQWLDSVFTAEGVGSILGQELRSCKPHGTVKKKKKKNACVCVQIQQISRDINSSEHIIRCFKMVNHYFNPH